MCDAIEESLVFGYKSEYIDEAMDLLGRMEPLADPQRLTWLKLLASYPATGWRDLPWTDRLDTAMAEARNQEKTVLLCVDSENSYSLKRLREQFFSHPALQRALQRHYVFCGLDPKEHPNVVAEYGMTLFPTLLVLDAEGNVVARRRAPADVPAFIGAFFGMPGWEGFTRGDPRVREAFLYDWRIVGPFPYEGGKGFDEIHPPEKELNFAASYQGKNGPIEWKAYTCPETCATVPLDQLYLDAKDSVFYACARFTVPAQSEGVLNTVIADGGCAWLDGQFLPGFAKREKTTHCLTLGVNLDPGEHVLLLKLFCVYHCTIQIFVLEQGGAQIEGFQIKEQPECPRITIPKRPGAAQADIVSPQTEEETTHVRVNKDMVLREWRQNYATMLAKMNPRPYMKDGKIIGIQGDRIGEIPSFVKAGFRDGDILLSVNGYGLESGMSVFEIAKANEKSKAYDLKLLRNGKEHHILIEVEGK